MGMTIQCDSIAILQGDFHSHEGWWAKWVLSGNEGDKNLRWIRWWERSV